MIQQTTDPPEELVSTGYSAQQATTLQSYSLPIRMVNKHFLRHAEDLTGLRHLTLGCLT